MDDLFTIVERGKKEWESAVDSISEGVALFDRTTLIVRRANWPLSRWLDSTPHRMVGILLLDALADCQAPDFDLETLLRATSSAFQEVNRKSTGQTWLLSVSPIVIPDQAGTHSVVVIRDVTQEKLLQQGIIDAEKRAAMVRTVGGLAQQIIPSVGYVQQQLSTINSHMSEMRSAFVDYRTALRTGENQIPRSSPTTAGSSTQWETIEARHRVEFMFTDIDLAIRQAMQDLMKIYKSLDDLGDLQGPAPKMQFHDLNLILENTINYVWPELRNKISIERRYQRNLPLVRCNQIRLQTALMALLTYCTQYIDEAGHVILSTQRENELMKLVIQSSGSQDEIPEPTNLWSTEAGLDQDPKAGLVHNILQEHSGELMLQIGDEGQLIATVTLPIEGPQKARS